MKDIKKLILFGLLIILAVQFSNCQETKTTEIEQFNGNYKAVTFTQPTDLDGSVDILAYGGSLIAEFSYDNKLSLFIDIPEESRAIYGAPKGNYPGNFSISSDTIHFLNTGTFFDSVDYYFLIKENQLVLREFTGHMKAFKIVMKKQ